MKQFFKHHKRVISFLLCLCMVLTMVPLTAVDTQAYYSSAKTPLPDGQYKSWKQFDDAWGYQPLGDGVTLRKVGCLVTAISMIAGTYGLRMTDGTKITPGTFSQRLYDGGSRKYLSSGGAIMDTDAVCSVIAGLSYYKRHSVNEHGLKLGDPDGMATAASHIRQYLNDGSAEYAVIARVNGSTAYHYVLVDHVGDDNTIYICDPGHNERPTLDYYVSLYSLAVFKVDKSLIKKPEDAPQTDNRKFNINYYEDDAFLDSFDYTSGSSATIKGEADFGLYRAGCTFMGWSDSPSSSKVIYQAGKAFTVSGNKDLYTVWRIDDVNFSTVRSYKNNFSDLKTWQWFYDNTKYAYELGVIDGVSATEFKPDNNVTVAQCIKLAACLNDLYNEGKIYVTNSKTGNWYDSYVEFAIDNGIIAKDKYKDMNAPATRRQVAEILGAALPDYSFKAINNIKDGGIPDVGMNDQGAYFIYLLYRAGVLTGIDSSGKFAPDTNVSRAQIATVVARLAQSSRRAHI
ncbi:MAG: S-layer homology domain-containing protein [Oscillospiraceae bacterium]|nr:S-layer homology domain-containing protein [Oscillospiraceae bacterium]